MPITANLKKENNGYKNLKKGGKKMKNERKG
jgi:hypothetical protein